MALNKVKTVIACSNSLGHFPRLNSFKLVDLKSAAEGIRVLGVPLGGSEFVKSDLNLLLEKVAKFCRRVTELDHPQAATLLLSKCCGVCRVAHALKVLHPSVVSGFVAEFDKLMLTRWGKLRALPLMT